MMFGYWPMSGMMWIWLLVIGGLCYWAFGWSRPRRYRAYPVRRDSMEIARERLAKGEITPEEFDEIMNKLRG